MLAQPQVSVRLGIVGDEIVKNALVRLGADGEAALKRISFDTSGQRSGLDNLVQGFDSLKGALLGAVAVLGIGGLWESFKGALTSAEDLHKLGEETGLTTQQIQKLQYAGLQFGISSDEMTAGLRFFAKALGDELINQSGPGAKAFENLGITSRIAAGEFHTTGDVLDAVIAKLSTFKDRAIVAGYASQLFGRQGGVEMAPMLSAGGDALEKFNEQAVKTGFVLSDQTVDAATQANDRLNTLFATIKNEGVGAAAALAPEIGELAKQITDALPSIVTWAEKWADWFGIIHLSPVEKLKIQIQDLQTSIDKTQSQRSGAGWFTHTFGVTDAEFATLLSADKAKLETLQSELAKLQKASPAPIGAPSAKPAALTLGAKAGAAAEAEKKNLEDANQIIDRLAKTWEDGAKAADYAKKEFANLTSQGATAHGQMISGQDALAAHRLDGQSGYFDAVAKMNSDQLQQRYDEIAAERQKEIQSLDVSKLSYQQYQDALLQIQQIALDKRAAAEAENSQKEIDLVKSREGALAPLIQKGMEDTNTAFKGVAADGLNSLEQGFLNVIRGTENVGQAFKTMVASILSEIAKLVLEKQVIAPLAGLLNGFIDGGGFGGFGGADATGTLDTAGTPITGAYAKGGVFARGAVTAFAGGGIVDNATLIPMALMGEAGPEAVIPLARGSNGKLGIAGGGSGDVHNHFSPTININGGGNDDQIAALRTELNNQKRDFFSNAVQAYAQAKTRRILP